MSAKKAWRTQHSLLDALPLHYWILSVLFFTVIIVSLTGNYIMYRTAIALQANRLQELVLTRASLARAVVLIPSTARMLLRAAPARPRSRKSITGWLNFKKRIPVWS